MDFNHLGLISFMSWGLFHWEIIPIFLGVISFLVLGVVTFFWDLFHFFPWVLFHFALGVISLGFISFYPLEVISLGVISWRPKKRILYFDSIKGLPYKIHVNDWKKDK